MAKTPKKLKTNNFLSIRAEWYDKLAQCGFVDIEDWHHQHSPLKSWHSLRWRNKEPIVLIAQQAYFSKASQFLNEYIFETEEEHQIWFFHSEGFSVREIEAKLSISRSHVHKIIVNLREKMNDLDSDTDE